jgi:hypothetical protein
MAPFASCAVQRAYVHLPRFPWSPHMYLRCARSLRRVCVSHVGAVFACVPNAAPRGVLRFQRCSRRVRVQHQRKSGVRSGRVTLLTLLTRAFFFRDGADLSRKFSLLLVATLSPQSYLRCLAETIPEWMKETDGT